MVEDGSATIRSEQIGFNKVRGNLSLLAAQGDMPIDVLRFLDSRETISATKVSTRAIYLIRFRYR